MMIFSRHRIVVLGCVVLGLLVQPLGFAQQASAYAQQDDPALANMDTGTEQSDPPARVARIAVLEGDASLEPANADSFSPAEINYPMTSGDRLYAGQGTVAEIQTGQIAVRLGQTSDVTVSAMTDTLAQFGLAGGSVHLREYSLDPGTTVELDTPNAAITVVQPGDIRVDVDPNSNQSYVTVLSGQVQVDGANYEQVLGAGVSIELNGLNPLQVTSAEAPQQDPLDAFSSDRDRAFEAGAAQDAQYVNDATVGGSDLGEYGDWSDDGDVGPVWYPRGVAVDWAPYQVGHWAYVAPWGWTWVEAEPWGFAPFHYGRWTRVRDRWGWVPGPRIVHPVYAPALVVFVGGNGFAGGVTAWFPLGPGEVYRPWYTTSPRYVNRVNVANLWTRNTGSVRAIYDARTVNPAFAAGLQGRQFAYRDHAVGMQQAAFASGRRANSNGVKLSPGQLAAAPVLARPTAAPVRGDGARVAPAQASRPVLDARDGNRGGNGAPIERRGPVVGQQNGGGPGRGVTTSPGRSGPVQTSVPPGDGEREGAVAPAHPGRSGPVNMGVVPRQPVQEPQSQQQQPGRSGDSGSRYTAPSNGEASPQAPARWTPPVETPVGRPQAPVQERVPMPREPQQPRVEPQVPHTQPQERPQPQMQQRPQPQMQRPQPQPPVQRTPPPQK